MERCTGCKKRAHRINCYLPVYDEADPQLCVARLCADCCRKQGFCRFCGEFAGGIESFEFWHPGICDYCDHQMRTEMENYPDDVPWDWEEA